MPGTLYMVATPIGNLEDVSDVLADDIRSFLNGLGHNGHIHLREKAHREDAAQTLGLDAVMTLKKVPTWTFLGNDRIHRHVDGKVAFLEIAEFHDNGIIKDLRQAKRIRILMLRNRADSNYRDFELRHWWILRRISFLSGESGTLFLSRALQ